MRPQGQRVERRDWAATLGWDSATQQPRFEGAWESVVLGRIAETYGGLTGKSKSDFGNGAAEYVSFLDVLENVVLRRQRFDRVRVSRSESQNRVRVGDVLFNATSETPEDLAMGSVVRVNTGDLYLNSFCFGLRIIDQERCDPLYLAYLSRAAPGRRAMYALAQGATRYNLSKKRFLALRLPLPSLPEQRAITAVLSDVEGLIGSLKALIAKNRSIKRAAMQQLLTGRTRLPGFEGEWKGVVLGRIAETYGGLTGKSKSDFGNGAAEYVSFLDVLENVVLRRQRFDRVRVSRSESQNRVRVGDVLFNATSETPEDLAMGSVVRVNTGDLYLNSFCFGLRIIDQERCDPLYLAYLSRAAPGRRAMYALAQGATRYNLSKKRFLALRLPLPSLPEQRAIATVLSDMDAEIDALERRLDKTRAIKKGMMQQLLTGAIRLPIPGDGTEGDADGA